MKKIKYICLLWILVSLLLCLPMVAKAEEPLCSLTVQTETEKQLPLANLSIGICPIAYGTADSLSLAKAFEGSNLSLEILKKEPSSAHANAVYDYIQKNHIFSAETNSDKSGKAVFNQLKPGLYLVFCLEEQDYTFRPYFVSLPTNYSGESVYDLSSKPKTQPNIPITRSVTLRVEWKDEGNKHGKRPDEIIVTLLKNNEPYEQVTLTEKNGWTYQWNHLPVKDVYTINQKDVPHYETTYSGNEQEGFLITNSYYRLIPPSLLPDTGDGQNLLLWLLLLLGSGGLFVSLLIKKKSINA